MLAVVWLASLAQAAIPSIAVLLRIVDIGRAHAFRIMFAALCALAQIKLTPCPHKRCLTPALVSQLVTLANSPVHALDLVAHVLITPLSLIATLTAALGQPVFHLAFSLVEAKVVAGAFLAPVARVSFGAPAHWLVFHVQLANPAVFAAEHFAAFANPSGIAWMTGAAICCFVAFPVVVAVVFGAADHRNLAPFSGKVWGTVAPHGNLLPFPDNLQVLEANAFVVAVAGAPVLIAEGALVQRIANAFGQPVVQNAVTLLAAQVALVRAH